MYISKHLNIFKLLFSEHTIIAWMLIASIAPMLGFAYFFYQDAKNTLHDSISKALLREIDHKVDEINYYIYEKKLNLIQLSTMPQWKELLKSKNKTAQLSNYLSNMGVRIGAKNFYISDMNGNIIYSLNSQNSIGKNAKNLINANLYNAFDGARTLDVPYLYSAFNGKNNAGLNIYLSNIINIDNIAYAVLIMQLDPHDIEKIVRFNFSYTRSNHTLLAMSIDDKTQIVMSTKLSDHLNQYPQALLEILKNALTGDMPLTPTEVFNDNTTNIAIYSYVPQLHMGMAVEYDKAKAYKKIYKLRLSMIVIMIIDLLSVIMIVLWIAGLLREAHRKSERLLENILPKFVANELKEHKHFDARHLPNVSIVFIDLINFTAFFLSQEPATVVMILDELFSIFDNLCDIYQLEKIKTIGDAYMAAAGLIVAQNDHAKRAIELGLGAIAAIKTYNSLHNTSFSIRVGIDSGDVVAGIIGKKKFSYDLWGNAVNCASRMETTGIADALHISAHTYAALIDKSPYNFTERPHIYVKGIGEMNTYSVTRAPSTPSPAL